MPTQREFAGRVLDDSGTFVSGASVDIFDSGTTTPSRVAAVDTTDSIGEWDLTPNAGGPSYDVVITNGSDVIRWNGRDQVQLETLQIVSPAAGEYGLVATSTEDAASVEVAVFEGDRATMADGDVAFNSYSMSDDGGNQEEVARVTWTQNDVNPSADGGYAVSVAVAGTLRTAWDVNVTAGGTMTHSWSIGAAVDLILSVNLLDVVNGTILELNELMRWDTAGAAVTAGAFQFGRDDGGVQHSNVPTGSTFEWSVNDVAQMTLSATAVDFLNNTIVTTGLITGSGGFSGILGATGAAAITGTTIDATTDFTVGATIITDGVITDATGILFAAALDFNNENMTNVDIDSGAIDGTVIGAASVAAGSFAAVVATTINGSADMTIVGQIILNAEDEMWIGPAADSGNQTNSNLTTGLSINQETADDFVLSLYSSDPDHGMTTVMETDSFAAFGKNNGEDGGLLIEATTGGSNQIGFLLRANAAAQDATKSTSGIGVIEFRGADINGTGRQTMAAGTADANIFVIRDNTTTRVIFDEDGDIHLDAGGGAGSAVLAGSGTAVEHSTETVAGYNIYDDEPDWLVGRAIHASLVPETDFGQKYAGLVERFRPMLEARGVVTYNDDTDGHHFIAMKRLALFQLDGLYQVGDALVEMAGAMRDAGIPLPDKVQRLMLAAGA